VRVDIDASKSVPVHREEIYERIKRKGQRRPPRRAFSEGSIELEIAAKFTKHRGDLGGNTQNRYVSRRILRCG
jgi:hypothetical protein